MQGLTDFPPGTRGTPMVPRSQISEHRQGSLRPMSSVRRPSGQLMHTVCPVSFWYVSSGHGMQVVVPLAGWYFPSSHTVHTPCATTSVYDPGAHGGQNVAPSSENVPGAQREQLAARDAFENVPGRHSWQVDAPQNE